MRIKKLSFALTLVTALASVSAAADSLTMDDQWHAFDIDELSSNSGGLEWIDLSGNALSFSFAGPATLTVVDGGFAGDRFEIFDNGVLLGVTSAAVNSYPHSVGVDFDAAYDNLDYSRGIYRLEGGNHMITGQLLVSALDDGPTAINATVGALQISPVPEADTYLMMLLGLGLVSFMARRRLQEN